MSLHLDSWYVGPKYHHEKIPGEILEEILAGTPKGIFYDISEGIFAGISTVSIFSKATPAGIPERIPGGFP